MILYRVISFFDTHAIKEKTMDEKEKILEAKQVYKIYKGRPVIRNVTLSLHAGECALITGESGSGKTTLLRLLSGTMQPTTGNIWLRPKLSKQYKPEGSFKKMELSAYQFLHSMAMVDGYSRHKAEDVCRRMFTHYRLSGAEHVAVSDLSDSMFRKLMLAQTMLKPCELLLLDEPFMGIDHEMREVLFADMIKLKQQNTAILMTCPINCDGEGREALADKIWHIKHGKIKETDNGSHAAI